MIGRRLEKLNYSLYCKRFAWHTGNEINFAGLHSKQYGHGVSCFLLKQYIIPFPKFLITAFKCLEEDFRNWHIPSFVTALLGTLYMELIV